MIRASDKTTSLERDNESLREQVAMLQSRVLELTSRVEGLRESVAKYRHLHLTRIDGFVRTSMDGRIEEVNEAFCRMVGYSEEELFSRTYRDLTPEKWHESEEAIIHNEVLVSGRSEPYEKEYRCKDGTTIPIELRTFLITDPAGGPPIGLAAVVRDITRRKRGEQALRESEEKFKSAFLTSQDACYIGTFADGLVIEINPAFERMFGYSRHEAIDHTSQQLGLWANHDDRLRMGERLLEDGFVKEMETRARRKNGEEFPCSLSTTALHMQGRHCVIGVVRDISERKRAEAALEQAQQRLRDLSVRLMNAQEVERARLARELHDDFSQRLALLAVNLHLLRQSMPDTATTLRDSVTALYTEVQGLARDVRRTSYDLHPARLEQLGLASAVRGLCHDLRTAHGVAIQFEGRDVPRDMPEPIALCLYRVTQGALQNVVEHSGAKEAVVELTVGDGEVKLIVADHGCGFDTAAPEGKAALGLASIRERVHAMAGWFEVKSEIGKGTRVEVRVPLASTS